MGCETSKEKEIAAPRRRERNQQESSLCNPQLRDVDKLPAKEAAGDPEGTAKKEAEEDTAAPPPKSQQGRSQQDQSQRDQLVARKELQESAEEDTAAPPPAAGSAATNQLLTSQPSPAKTPSAQKKKGFALKAKDSDEDSSGDSAGGTGTNRRENVKVGPLASRTKKTAAATGITVNDKGELVVAAAPAPKRKKSKAAMSHVDPTTGESSLPELNFYPEDYGLCASSKAEDEGEDDDGGDDMQFSDAEDMDAGGQDDAPVPDATPVPESREPEGDAASMLMCDAA